MREAIVCVLPVFRIEGLEGAEGKGIAHDLSQCLERLDLSKRNRLDEDVSGGGRLNRTCDHLAPRGIGRKLVEERTLTAAANDVQSRDRAPGEFLDLIQRRAVRESQAFQDTAGELARTFAAPAVRSRYNRPRYVAGMSPDFANRVAFGLMSERNASA